MQAGAFPPERALYEVRIKGHLDGRWGVWFEGLAIAHLEDGTTLLAGPVGDQSALQDLLLKIATLGLTLLPIHRDQTRRGIVRNCRGKLSAT